MAEVIVSPKYQVVIPKEIRKQMHLKTGQKVLVVAKEGIITLIPDHPLKEYRGYLKGMKTGNLREEEGRI